MLQATRCENIFYNEVDSYWFFRMMPLGILRCDYSRLGDLAGAYFEEEASGTNFAAGFAMKREF